jgi:hypothetical protein
MSDAAAVPATAVDRTVRGSHVRPSLSNPNTVAAASTALTIGLAVVAS